VKQGVLSTLGQRSGSARVEAKIEDKRRKTMVLEESNGEITRMKREYVIERE
jgi:hypothetical protein